MQVRPGYSTRLADGPKNIAAFQPVSRLDVDTAEVCVEADQSLAVIDIDPVAAEEKVAGFDHGTVSGYPDVSSLGGGDIKTVVGISFLLVEKPAQSEDAADLSADRPDEFDIRRVSITDRFPVKYPLIMLRSSSTLST